MDTCSVPSCDRPVRTKGWCNAHYMRWWHTGDVDAERPLATKDRTPAERFEQFVGAAELDGCILWQGSIGRTGYGYFTVNGRSKVAHRFAYESTHGSLPEGQQLDHLCHTRDRECRGGVTCRHRRCVNPAHLEPVTPKENNNRGRAAELARERRESSDTCAQGHPYTPENTGRSTRGYRYCRECNRLRARAKSLKAQGAPDPRRTSQEQVAQIPSLLGQGGMSGRAIAAAVGVSRRTVARVRAGGSWFSELP